MGALPGSGEVPPRCWWVLYRKELVTESLLEGGRNWWALDREYDLPEMPCWVIMKMSKSLEVLRQLQFFSVCVCKCRLLCLYPFPKCVPMQNALWAAGRTDEWKRLGAFCRALLYLAKSKQLVYSPTCLWNWFAHTRPQPAASFPDNLFPAVSLRRSSSPEDYTNLAAGLGKEGGSALGSRGQDPEWSEMRS